HGNRRLAVCYGSGDGRGGESISFFLSSRRGHTRCYRDWSSDVCSSDLLTLDGGERLGSGRRDRDGMAQGSHGIGHGGRVSGVRIDDDDGTALTDARRPHRQLAESHQALRPLARRPTTREVNFSIANGYSRKSSAPHAMTWSRTWPSGCAVTARILIDAVSFLAFSRRQTSKPSSRGIRS